MVEFNATKEESLTIQRIVTRAFEGGTVPSGSRMDLLMDLEAVHSNGCRLNLAKLESFDDFNFAHDIRGIQQHINRRTGKLENFFLPRCAA